MTTVFKKGPVTLNPEIVTQRIGPFKLKDHPLDRRGAIISNKAGAYIVVTEIAVVKVTGTNNKFDVVLTMPDPKTVDVVKRETKTVEVKGHEEIKSE